MAVDLLLTAGNGPVECRIALASLISEIRAAARRDNCTAEVHLGEAPDRHGPKSATVTIEGDNEHTVSASFVGTIRFIFTSPVRPGHKRRNWFVGVSRIEPVEPAAHHGPLDRTDVRFETLRAGGPGGQHQNTTDSAVRATHIPTGLSVLAREERSQHRNKARALARLEGLLQAMNDAERNAGRAATFRANRNLERGNEVCTFKL